MPRDKELNKARSYALRLLKIRQRSEEELRFRLRQKRFTPDTINFLIANLKDAGFVDDLRFAFAWAKEKINKPLGFKRIVFELKQKNIKEPIIEEVVSRIKNAYSEHEAIKNIISSKFDNTVNKTEGKFNSKARNRIFGFLLRRGFSPEAISEVLNKL
ncbi:MAG: hypothetical protein COV72_08860 [Candidatus Omnitrophica bacterium CG11_big_fil_rev_8_21_14_0_20_42_13]|uniref:Regulatory protein RecX n=1 Tax=Candidatus Ghiorseimicrobium undicola TaxID=1974746 RepID=A0A2H0LVF6_9BACT|nr:MAG: hypothetical protein COV72_08860 [Candidatus Omnitrophica bacterium CG11_big_fil_rev_8_21_14_0_20_42_13]